MAVDRLAVYRLEDVGEQSSRGAWFKDDWHTLRFDFARAQAAQDAIGSYAADVRGRFDSGKTARHGYPVIALHGIAFTRYGRGGQRAVAGTIFARESSGIREDAPAGA